MTTDGLVVAGSTVRRRYLDLIDELSRTDRGDLAAQVIQLAVDQGIWAQPLQRPLEYVASGSDRPVYDPDDFWFVHHLQAHYEGIRAEVDATAGSASGFSPVEEPLLAAGRWDQVVLYEGGRRHDEACQRFPFTTQVVEQIPEATTLGPGVVTLSLLAPGSHVRAHCGRTNAQLRVHLGLKIPPGAAIRVGEERLTWQEGCCLVFDDSFEHEVWHDGTEPRLVLLLDVLHPGLTEAHRSRLLAARRRATEQIAAYLAEHGIQRVESDQEGLILRPAEGLAALIRRYMAETGARFAELRDRKLHLR
jgi:aspartate beta-hydroxylase